MFNRIQLEDEDDDEEYDLNARRRSRSASYFRAHAPRKSISEGHHNQSRRKKSTVSQFSQFSDEG